MLAKNSLTGQGLSDTELYDQVITLMLAGHEVNLNITLPVCKKFKKSSGNDTISLDLVLSKYTSVHCCITKNRRNLQLFHGRKRYFIINAYFIWYFIFSFRQQPSLSFGCCTFSLLNLKCKGNWGKRSQLIYPIVTVPSQTQYCPNVPISMQLWKKHSGENLFFSKMGFK